MAELISKVLISTEFWSALVGALIGGFIALAAQTRERNEARRQREEDHKRGQQALAGSLLFKMRRIHSNYIGVAGYIEECFAEAATKAMHDEPWRFLLPLPSLPKPVNFSSEEMGMLLAQRDDEVFNSMSETDELHNLHVEALATLQLMRRNLMERIPPENVSGDRGSVVLPREEYAALRPRMIEVNSLVEQLRNDAHDGISAAGSLLHQLQYLLRKRLDLPYKVGPAPDRSLSAQQQD